VTRSIAAAADEMTRPPDPASEAGRPDDDPTLREEHPELRPLLIAPDEIHASDQSRRLVMPGAYEWWQIEAFDEWGTGVRIMFAVADPFDQSARALVRRGVAAGPRDRGAAVGALARARRRPALRVSVFRRMELVARSLVRFGAAAVEERRSGPRTAWRLRLGPSRLESDGTGWSIRLVVPLRRLGLRGLLDTDPVGGSTLRGEFVLAPRFETCALQRASMPNAPSGAQHDWLISGPALSASGQVTWGGADLERGEITLESADTALEHFWGTGLLGDGMRRWYRTRLADRSRVVYGEMPVIRKFIQLAGTVVRFRPGATPSLHRCRPPRTRNYQRSAWLLAFPAEFCWESSRDAIRLVHELDRLADAGPAHAFALTRSRYIEGIPPDEQILGPRTGTFEIVHPERLDWRCWRPWIHAW